MTQNRVAAVFDWAGDGPSVAGVHDPAERWNGWACPSFPMTSVRAIAEWIDSQPDAENYSRVIIEGDKVFISEDKDDRYEVVADKDGLYPVGAWAWVWHECDDDQDRDAYGAPYGGRYDLAGRR